jgi:hypothetical protein
VALLPVVAASKVKGHPLNSDLLVKSSGHFNHEGALQATQIACIISMGSMNDMKSVLSNQLNHSR